MPPITPREAKTRTARLHSAARPRRHSQHPARSELFSNSLVDGTEFDLAVARIVDDEPLRVGEVREVLLSHDVGAGDPPGDDHLALRRIAHAVPPISLANWTRL
ncbi:hypothetical protein CKO28_25820 [Rhodovibrio sodomensis]|uniref:Uncharacterized protein n=1 Tax=Rhodovibrio sodomensis TaxID=1088 RepID=A0ABS1DNY3_9PROT|nr:hypothetical protein [Rhodovibrio sodomensis]